MSANGFNPMRHNCERDGCFNKKERPKIEMFCDCFPGKINFGDGDGKVEIHGFLLFLEWKKEPIDLPAGQRIMYERITVGKNISTICVAGNAETMEITHRGWFKDGVWTGWVPSSFQDVCRQIRKWVMFAETHNPKWELHRSD